MDINEHSTAVLAVKGETALSIVLAGIAAADAGQQAYEARQREEQQGEHLTFPANYFKTASQEQFDLYWGLKEAMTFLPATSMVEAAAQVGQAINEVSLGYDNLPEGEEIDKAYQAMQKKVERLLHSVMRALEAAGDFSLDRMGLASLRNANCDPWAETEELVLKLRSEGVK
jgi:hypothetical protein